MLNETTIIGRLCRVIPSRGIGDDAAIVRLPRNREWVVSTDSFIEGVHFKAGLHLPDSVGYKALMRAASDLAAMGAEPRTFLLALSVPSRRTGLWLDAFALGMSAAAKWLRMRLIGGDVSRNDRIVATLTVMGETRVGRALTRSGARPGDGLYVSGWLGAAQAGLEYLLSRGKWAYASESYSLGRHLYPEARVDLGEWLADHKFASSALDLSDGLSTDLARLCAASKVGAVVRAESLPIRLEPMKHGRRASRPSANRAALRRALHGGEDYELLFTVPPRLASRIPRHFQGSPITRIGEITSKRSVRLIDENGHGQVLKARGWDHFSR